MQMSIIAVQEEVIKVEDSLIANGQMSPSLLGTVPSTALTVERTASERHFWLGFKAELEGESSETSPRATRLSLGISCRRMGWRRDFDRGHVVGDWDWRRSNFSDFHRAPCEGGGGDESFLHSFNTMSIHRHTRGNRYRVGG